MCGTRHGTTQGCAAVLRKPLVQFSRETSFGFLRRPYPLDSALARHGNFGDCGKTQFPRASLFPSAKAGKGSPGIYDIQIQDHVFQFGETRAGADPGRGSEGHVAWAPHAKVEVR